MCLAVCPHTRVLRLGPHLRLQLAASAVHEYDVTLIRTSFPFYAFNGARQPYYKERHHIRGGVLHKMRSWFNAYCLVFLLRQLIFLSGHINPFPIIYLWLLILPLHIIECNGSKKDLINFMLLKLLSTGLLIDKSKYHITGNYN